MIINLGEFHADYLIRVRVKSQSSENTYKELIRLSIKGVFISIFTNCLNSCWLKYQDSRQLMEVWNTSSHRRGFPYRKNRPQVELTESINICIQLRCSL